MAMILRMTNHARRCVATKSLMGRRYLICDVQGSARALVDQSGAVTDTYEYWPYGEVRSSSGATGNKLLYCGALGYIRDTISRTYVRARHLRLQLQSWLTLDSYWPRQRAYVYADCNPKSYTDRDGTFVSVGNGCTHDYSSCCGKLDGVITNPKMYEAFAKCMKRNGYDRFTDDLLTRWSNTCKDPSIKFCVYCSSKASQDFPPGCPDPCKDNNSNAMMVFSLISNWDDFALTGCSTIKSNLCMTPAADGCQCAVIMCEDEIYGGDDDYPQSHTTPCSLMFHEMTHCYGIGHNLNLDLRKWDLIYRATNCCLCEAFNSVEPPDRHGLDWCASKCKPLFGVP